MPASGFKGLGYFRLNSCQCAREIALNPKLPKLTSPIIAGITKSSACNPEHQAPKRKNQGLEMLQGCRRAPAAPKCRPHSRDMQKRHKADCMSAPQASLEGYRGQNNYQQYGSIFLICYGLWYLKWSSKSCWSLFRPL